MFYWLATDAAAFAESAESHGFGLNFDILEANLINLAIVIAVLIYFGRGFLGGMLSERRSTIETEIVEAEKRQREAAEKLAGEQQKLEQAKAEAQRIVATAEATAKAAKTEILERAAQEIERIKASASQDQTSSQERAIAELRQQIAAQALKQVEAQLKAQLSSADAQQRLVDRSIALLGGHS